MSAIQKTIIDIFRPFESVSYVCPLDYAVLGNALYHPACCWQESRHELLLIDYFASSISVKTYASEGGELKTEVFKSSQWRRSETIINIFTSEQNTEGILLEFYAARIQRTSVRVCFTL